MNHKSQLFNILNSNDINFTQKLNIYTDKHSSPYYISETDDYCYDNLS